MTVMTMGATAVQMPAGAPSEMSQSASGSESVVEATMAEKKPTSVMATWMAARNWPESPGELERHLGALVALVCVMLEDGALRRDERGLRHREVAVGDGENEREDDAERYSHDGTSPHVKVVASGLATRRASCGHLL